MSTKRDLLSVTDLTADETLHVLRRATEMKSGGDGPRPLQGKSIALLFEKPSLRTRSSFQVGIQQLGGFSFYLGPEEVGLGTREPASDVARVLSGYVDGIVARVFSHESLQELAANSTVPVINALSDWEHPCQTMADLLTIQENKHILEGLNLTFVGDGNNVARSLCLALPPVGMSFTIAAPSGYCLDQETLDLARSRAAESEPRVQTLTEPAEAVQGVDVIYTDAWTSMGQEAEAEVRRGAFQGYTVDGALMEMAGPGALFMHDMPVHYGEEVVPGMLDHPQSVAYSQAHNRLHAQKAILELLLGGE
jgi:ornithine carbamoyltransferase